jgi:hypothetical protein
VHAAIAHLNLHCPKRSFVQGALCAWSGMGGALSLVMQPFCLLASHVLEDVEELLLVNTASGQTGHRELAFCCD